MKIISKGNKDYYDYLMGIYGQDELVVYDRRDCYPIDPSKKWGDDVDRNTPIHCSDFQNLNVEKWFRKEVMCFDKPRREIKMYSTNKLNVYKEYWANDKHRRHGIVERIMEGQVYHFLLEVGYHHFIFEVERYIDDKDENKIHLEYDLVRTYDVPRDKRIGYAPIALCPLDETYAYTFFREEREFKVSDKDKEKVINNPILYSTYIPKFISAEDMWHFLYEYISSLRDKEFIDTRTNEQHIESNGFDKKISFRHRK